jgi:ABC-2 type transport system permease protein
MNEPAQPITMMPLATGGALAPAEEPSTVRAWINLIRASWYRQARAHLMVWIGLGLLLLVAAWVALVTRMGAWDPLIWQMPRRNGMTYEQWALYLRMAPASVLANKGGTESGIDTLFGPKMPSGQPKGPSRNSERWANLNQAWYKDAEDKKGPPPPMTLVADPVQIAVAGSVSAVLENEKFRRDAGTVRFTQVIVFGLFTTFLLPLCSLGFATEALGRECEQRNLLWTLTRPLPRWSIYIGKFVAMLPWCIALNLAGFLLICALAGAPGFAAFALFWPAALLGTVAFASLYHLMGAIFRRPAVMAILYSFFLETVMGNLPGHLKRASINFYMRSYMYDCASVFQLQPDRPLLYSPVSGPVAVAVLLGITAVLLTVGSIVFTRAEYLDVG